MQTSAELKNLLQRIDHKGYPAYKDTRGSYEFPGYVLSIDHVPVSYTHLPHEHYLDMSPAYYEMKMDMLHESRTR